MTLADIALRVHPDYSAHADAWERAERLLRGGADVYDELLRYSWETDNPDGYEARRGVAVYPDLPAQCAESFVGTLFASPPAPDWGSLGVVREQGDRSGTVSAAEMLYDNADGTGSDASGWDAFWSDEMAAAMGPGHRWGMMEAPAERPASRADEMAGRRPYLVGLSPLAVPNWLYLRGALQHARVLLSEPDPVTGDPRLLHYILIRRGYEGFGPEFAGGGWWIVDADGAVVRQGTLEATGGDVPMWRLYYDRPTPPTLREAAAAGGRGAKAAGATLARNRVGLTHLGNCAVEIMNLGSALFNDAWVSGSRKRFFLGADPAQWAVIVDAAAGGGVEVPVPGSADGGNVTIYDSGAASASGGILAAIEQAQGVARQLVRRELETAPDASGTARRLAYKNGQSPRLASMAMSLEDAQNIALLFAARLWGKAPGTQGSVTWPKEYDLRTATERAEGVLGLLALAKAGSPTLVSEAVGLAAEGEGLLSGDVSRDVVTAEVKADLLAQAGANAAFGALGSLTGATDPADLDPNTGGDA